ncbi:MAG: DUF5652 family protein [Parcubacteria group bacterium]
MDPITLNQIQDALGISMTTMLIILAWTLIWKGLALWKSARDGNKLWFVLLLILSTLGILEILYIFVFSKYKKVDQPTSE